MEEKICACCWTSKPIKEFYATVKQYYCKECIKKKVAEWRKNNPERVKENNARQQLTNKEKTTKWDREHPEQAKERKRRWYLANREKVKAASAKWAKEHPDKAKEYSLRWRQKYPDKYKASNAKQNKGGFLGKEKVCGCCWLTKPIEEFYTTGKQCYCKVCSRKKVTEWQKNNPEKNKARQKNWYRTNTEKAKAAATKWAKENPDKVREKARRWRQNNPLKAKIQDAKGNFKKKMKRQELANELRTT